MRAWPHLALALAIVVLGCEGATIPSDASVAIDAPEIDGGACPDDGDACTRERMEAGACMHAPWDDDGDGHAPAAECGPATSLQGGDCDDGNPAAHPGASELCDGRDQDCDLAIDEDFATHVCAPDVDGDGSPRDVAEKTLWIEQCLDGCPEGYADASADVDCDDEDPAVGACPP